MFGAVLREISLDCEWVGEELCRAVHWGRVVLGDWDWASLVITLYSDKIKALLSCLIQRWRERSAVVPLGNQTLSFFFFFSQSTHSVQHVVSLLQSPLWNLYFGLEDYYDIHFMLLP